MKTKIKTITVITVILLAFITVSAYALLPSEIERLNTELEQNRGQRIANSKIIKTLTEDNKILRERADEIKVEMFGEGL